MKSLRTKDLQNNWRSNIFAVLPEIAAMSIKRTTRKLLPTYRFFGNVEAPQAPAAGRTHNLRPQLFSTESWEASEVNGARR